MSGNTEIDNGLRESRWRFTARRIAAIILFVPLVAMQFTDEVDIAT